MEVVMAKKPFSHSQLETYENCPQQYKLCYIERIKPEEQKEGIEAFLGIRVHEALEKLYKELILTKINSIEALLQYYNSQWIRNWHDNVVVTKKEFTGGHYKSAGEKAIRDYYVRYSPFDQSKTIEMEMMLNFSIDEYNIKGFIDRLSVDKNNAYEIHDYKTSSRVPDQAYLDKARQLALYQIGIKEKYHDVKEVKLIWHYMLFDRELRSTRTDAQLNDLRKEVVSLIRKIEKDDKFEPNESRLCDWCEFTEYCPAKKHEAKVEKLPINKYLEEQGVTLVNKYSEIKTQISDLEKKQKELEKELELIEEAAIAYAEKENLTKIYGSDYTLKISEKTDFKFPLSKEQEEREKLERRIRELGIWERVSQLNLSALKKIVKEQTLEEPVLQEILKFAQKEQTKSVRLVKKRGREEEG
jgi:putative RecB family exonuclease